MKYIEISCLQHYTYPCDIHVAWNCHDIGKCTVPNTKPIFIYTWQYCANFFLFKLVCSAGS